MADKTTLSIVKIGGNIIDDLATLDISLKKFSRLPSPKILIHGGGKLATQFASKLGISSQMVDGRRITDSSMLEVITMIYAGKVNKNIVAKLQAYDCDAIGLSGADANLIASDIRPIKTHNFGFVGDIKQVNSSRLKSFIDMEITPVFCPISHNRLGQLLNTNADTIASEVAIAMSQHYHTQLYYCFEKRGVLENISDEDSVIPFINPEKYHQLKEQNIIAQGMLPKLENCFHALEHKVSKVFVGDISMLDAREDNLFTTLSL